MARPAGRQYYFDQNVVYRNPSSPPTQPRGEKYASSDGDRSNRGLKQDRYVGCREGLVGGWLWRQGQSHGHDSASPVAVRIGRHRALERCFDPLGDEFAHHPTAFLAVRLLV